MHHAGTHRRDRLVDDLQERRAAVVHRFGQFQRADGEAVQADVARLFDALDGAYVANLRVLRLLQIDEDGTCGDNAVFQVLDAEALEILHPKVGREFLVSRVEEIDPVVHLVTEELAAEVALEHRFASPFVQHFLGGEAAQQFVDIVGRAFGHKKLTRRDVEQRHAARLLAEVDRRQEVVLLVRQHRVAHGHARRHQFGDAALHQFLCQFRVFELVADGHAFTCTNQFRQIGVEGMVRKTSHGNAAGRRACHARPLRERDSQNVGSDDGIVVVGLVEVAATEQQDGIRVFRLEVVELLHHRGHFFLFRHALLFTLQNYYFSAI